MSLLSNILPSIGDDLLDQVNAAVYNFGWQNNVGSISFGEALPQLRTLLGELRELEDSGQIDALPKAAQQTLNNRLAQIQSYLAQIPLGNQTVQALTDEIDRLHLDMLTFNLRRSKRISGVSAKLAEIDRIMAMGQEVHRLRLEAESLRQQSAELTETFRAMGDEFEGRLEATRRLLQDANSYISQIVGIRDQSRLNQAQLTEFLEASSRHLAQIVAKVNEATIHEERINSFELNVDANEKRLADTVRTADETVRYIRAEAEEFQHRTEAEVAEFKSRTQGDVENFLARLKVVEEDINQKLRLATGASLFHAFGSRAEDMKFHWIWAVLAFIIVAATSFVLNGLLQGVNEFSVALAMKLAFAIPAGIAIAFALQQFGRERRLKEEYQFKSAISLSLEAYRDLVEKVVSEEDRTKYAEFLIKSISTIYDPPTDKVFGERRTRIATDTKIIGSALDLVAKAKDITK